MSNIGGILILKRIGRAELMVRTGTISGTEGIRRTNGRMKRKVGRMKSRCWDD